MENTNLWENDTYQLQGCPVTNRSSGGTSLCSNTCLQNNQSCPLANFNNSTSLEMDLPTRSQSYRSNSNSSGTPEHEMDDQISSFMDGATQSIQDFTDQKARQAHSLVEKKYRESLNGQIEKLRAILPNCSVEQDIEDQLAGTGPESLSKIAVLTTAYRLLSRLAAANKEHELRNREALSKLQGIQQIADCRSCGVTECARSYGYPANA